MKMWIFGVAALAAATCFGATTEDGVTKERRGALGPNDTVVTDVDTTGIVAARTYTKDEIDRRIATNAPVRSVNGRTGRVVLGASDVGALPNNRDDLKASANFRNAVWDVQIRGGGVDTNAVREIVNEVVAPVEAAVADRYTKAEADGRFVPMNFPEPYSGGFEWVPDGLALNSESVFTIPSSGNLMVGGYTLGEFLSRGFWNTSNNKFIRNDSFSVVSNKVEQKADKATTLSGYGITDAKIGYYEEKPFVQLGDSILYPLTSSGGTVSKLTYQEYIIGGLVRLGQDFIKLNDNEVVYGISTNGTDYAHANVNLKPWGESLISAENPSFSNAVLAVGIDTNAVAQIGELKEFFDDLPVGTVGTSLGGIILALLGAAALLKKKTSLLKSDGTAEDQFATDLLGKQVAKDAIDAEIVEKGTAPDAHLEAPTDERLKLILSDNTVAYDSAKALPYKLASAIGDRVIASLTLNAASTDIALPSASASDVAAKDFILDVTNAYSVEGVATDAGINIPRTDVKLVTRDGESLSDVTTVKAGKSAFLCFTQKSPVIVGGVTYPCWFVTKVELGDPA